jgi:hypothetical protein
MVYGLVISLALAFSALMCVGNMVYRANQNHYIRALIWLLFGFGYSALTVLMGLATYQLHLGV